MSNRVDKVATPTDFRQRVKLQLAACDASMRDLALACRMDYQRISHIVGGFRLPRPDEARAIARGVAALERRRAAIEAVAALP